MKEPKQQQALKNTIELYMSLDEKYHFGKGLYWDADGNPHALVAHIHAGTFQDTVLIYTAEGNLCVCRYYYQYNGVEFYDTLYRQQEYDKKMLIHNTSKDRSLDVSFEFYDREWTIKPEKSKEIIPFTSVNADV